MNESQSINKEEMEEFDWKEWKQIVEFLRLALIDGWNGWRALSLFYSGLWGQRPIYRGRTPLHQTKDCLSSFHLPCFQSILPQAQHAL